MMDGAQNTAETNRIRPACAGLQRTVPLAPLPPALRPLAAAAHTPAKGRGGGAKTRCVT